MIVIKLLHLRQTPLTAGTSSSSSCHSNTAVKNSVPDTCEINMVNRVNMIKIVNMINMVNMVNKVNMVNMVNCRIGEYRMVSDLDFDYGRLSC